MRPIGNNIIVKRNHYIQLPSGLIIDERATERVTCDVMFVGKGTEKNPMHVKVGDKVVIRKDIGTEIDYMKEKLLHLNESHVIAIL